MDHSTNQPIRTLAPVGIVGAGTMGVEIAAAHVAGGVDVLLHDSDPAALASAADRVSAEIGRPEYAAITSPHAAPRPVARRGALAECRLVIESIVEARETKRPLLAELDALLPPETILVSNTSTIPLADLATDLVRPDRLAGMHFCHPVRRRAAVELAATTRTRPAVMEQLVAHVAALGKMPVRVADSPGYVVNRALFPLLAAALQLLLEGLPPTRIDQAARQSGMESGPLELLDEIGLDVALRCGWELSAAFPGRIEASPLLVGLVKRKQFGVKTGVGIYVDCDAGTQQAACDPRTPSRGATEPEVSGNPDEAARATRRVNPTLLELIRRWGQPASVQPPDDRAIVRRLADPFLAEVRQLLAEGVVADPVDARRAIVHGLGFPEAMLEGMSSVAPPTRSCRMLR